MKLLRSNIFETNSSSTHSLVMQNYTENYLPPNSTILVEFIDTNDYTYFRSLQEKVSYLVSHIVNNYKYNAATYEDLIDDVKNSWDFKRLNDYVKEHFNKEIVFPAKYVGDLDDITSINHQLCESSLDSVLEDIVNEYHDYLDDILVPGKAIEIGHD